MKLYPHQEEVLKQTEKQNRVAYYLDMGLGKTFVGAEKLMNLDTRTNLLICQKSKIKDWSHHFFDYYPGITVFELREDEVIEMFLSFPYKKIGIINYELTFRRPELKKLTDFTLMLDESSMIQSRTAKRSKFVLNLDAKNVILLSGTPTSGKYENLYTQMQLLGWNISEELYWKQYIDTEWVERDGFFSQSVIGYKNVDRLKRKLNRHGAVFMKSEEVFDLPEQVFINVLVGKTKEYKKFMSTRIVKFDGIELVGETTLTKLLYARMLCGQYNKFKLEAFEDLVQSTDDRLIVFYNFNDELAKLQGLIADRPVSIVNGSIKDLEAYDQHDNSITFVQYQAGAMGLNLQKANKVIYFTLPQSSELFEQSKKRVHRIGQDKRCFYYYMMCAGSVEENILRTLEMRKDYSDELFKEYEECI